MTPPIWIFDSETGQAIGVSASLARRLAGPLLGGSEPLAFTEEKALEMLTRAQGTPGVTRPVDSVPDRSESRNGEETGHLLTVDEVADRLNVSSSSVRRLSSDELPWCRPTPGTIRYRVEDVDALIARNTNQ